MLKRKIEDTLIHWMNHSSNQALCIFGARQIGKTTSVEEFATQHFERFIKIDFIQSPEAKEIFDSTLDPAFLLSQIELFSRQEILKGKTLILLDEIQECPKARTAIKYLVQEGSCRYIETGSLLGVKLSQIPSVPVGFERLVNMYPLDFEEFMWGVKVPESTIVHLKECFKKRIPVPEFVHKQMLRLFLTYLVVGGMPKSVSVYIESQRIRESIGVQQDLWHLYSMDITKYAASSEIVKILDLYESVPSQLNSSNNRFILSQAADGKKVSFKSYQGALSWLTQAGIVLPSFNSRDLVFPLKLNEKRSLFRLYFLDTGMLCSQFDGIQLKILQQDPTLNWGAILENAAAQALCANGFQLYYFNSKNLGELDFVIEEGNEISILEMKSGKNYKSHPALNRALSQKAWPIKNAYVICSSNVETHEKITYLPWYMMFLIQKTALPEDLISFNFEPLDFEFPKLDESSD